MITEEARGLLAHAEGTDAAVLMAHMDWKDVADALETIANLRYEYAVQVIWGKNVTYAYKDDTGKGHFGPLAVWSWTRGDAAEFVAELKDFTPHTTARVVRRLVSDVEVVE